MTDKDNLVLPYVFVVEDDEVVRNSLAMLLEDAGYVIATFQSAEDFLNIYSPNCEGCIILDVNLPGMDGLALHEELIRRGLQLSVIFLSGYGSIPTTVRAIKAGALDFLTKPVQGAVLLTRVQEALEQCSLMHKQSEEYHSISSRLASLSEREREVMQLAFAGHTCKRIAQSLGISHRTVEIYRAHIMQKTGVSNLLELAQIVKKLELFQSQH